MLHVFSNISWIMECTSYNTWISPPQEACRCRSCDKGCRSRRLSCTDSGCRGNQGSSDSCKDAPAEAHRHPRWSRGLWSKRCIWPRYHCLLVLRKHKYNITITITPGLAITLRICFMCLSIQQTLTWHFVPLIICKGKLLFGTTAYKADLGLNVHWLYSFNNK